MSDSSKAGGPGDHGDVPVAKSAHAPGDTFEIAEDRCPKCGIPMPSLAVVCVKCGYDQRANVVREVTTGTVETPADPEPTSKAAPAAPAGKEFVEPGRLSSQALTIIGGVLTVGALVGAGVWGPRGSFWLVVASLAYTLYLIAVNTVTGVAAVAIAAKVSHAAFGRLDLAAARMFAAFALFQALVNVRYPLGYQVLTAGLPFLVGAAAYFGAIMLLFKKDRQTTSLIALGHFVLWLLLQLGPMLAGMMSVAGSGATPPPA